MRMLGTGGCTVRNSSGVGNPFNVCFPGRCYLAGDFLSEPPL